MVDSVIGRFIAFVINISNFIWRKLGAFVDKFFNNIKLQLFMMTILLPLIIFSFWLLNEHTTYVSDDFYFAYNLETGKRILDMADLQEAAINNYYKWSGRLCNGIFPSLFMMYEKGFFNLINTLMFLILISGMYFFAVGRRTISPAVLIIISGMLFLLAPVFGQVFLWISGATTYMWGLAPAVVFLILYRLQLDRADDIILPPYFVLLLAVLGFYVGWSNELVAFSAIISILTASILYYHEKKHLPLWMKIGLVSCGLGFLVLLAAPGNFARMGGVNEEYSIIKHILVISRWIWTPDALLYPVSSCILLSLLPKKQVNIHICAMLIAGALAAMYFMSIAPYIPSRVKVIPFIYLTVLAAYLYTKLNFSIGKVRYGLALFLVVLSVQMEYTFHDAYEAIENYEIIEKANVEHIQTEREAGHLDVEIKINQSENKYCAGWGTLNLDNYKPLRGRYATYYGVKSIKLSE